MALMQPMSISSMDQRPATPLYDSHYVEDTVTVAMQLGSYYTPLQSDLYGRELTHEPLWKMLLPGARMRNVAAIVGYSGLEAKHFPFNAPEQTAPRPVYSVPASHIDQNPPDIEELENSVACWLGIPEGEIRRPPTAKANSYWKLCFGPQRESKYTQRTQIPMFPATEFMVLTGYFFFDVTCLASKAHMICYMLSLEALLDDMSALNIDTLTARSMLSLAHQIVHALWHIIHTKQYTCLLTRQMYLYFLHFQQNVLAYLIASSPRYIELFGKRRVLYGVPGNAVPEEALPNVFRLLPRLPKHWLALRSIYYDQVFPCRPLSVEVLLCDADTCRYHPEEFALVQRHCLGYDWSYFLIFSGEHLLTNSLDCLDDLEDYMDILPVDYCVTLTYSVRQRLFSFGTCYERRLDMRPDEGEVKETHMQAPLFSSAVQTYVPLGQPQADAMPLGKVLKLNHSQPHVQELRAYFPVSYNKDQNLLSGENVYKQNTYCYMLPRPFVNSYRSTIKAAYELYALAFTPCISSGLWHYADNFVCQHRLKAREATRTGSVNVVHNVSRRHAKLTLDITYDSAKKLYVYSVGRDGGRGPITISVKKPSAEALYMWKIKPPNFYYPKCYAQLTGVPYDDLRIIQSYGDAWIYLYAKLSEKILKRKTSKKSVKLKELKEHGEIMFLFHELAEKQHYQYKSELCDVVFTYKMLLWLHARHSADAPTPFPYAPIPIRSLIGILNKTGNERVQAMAAADVLSIHSAVCYKAVDCASQWDFNAYRALVLTMTEGQEHHGDAPDFDNMPRNFNAMRAAADLHNYISAAGSLQACYPHIDMDFAVNFYKNRVCQKKKKPTDIALVRPYRSRFTSALAIPTTKELKHLVMWNPADTMRDIVADRRMGFY
ncbi:ORF50 [Ranid herpesvirus 2]|uniref:ORF50 n=1 Tax=Ranid herpesvirus 2 TaxID=389214 RepID=Q14W56_9VIRU|nr:ORF50 [Ranid herpesvirus 2]ABG25586.1 ORF50 [Ranid herpesvirus 2]